MRGGWGGYPRGGGGGPVVARAPAPREWRRGPWRQLAWGAVRERVCECVRAAGVARRAGPGGPCLPACRRPRPPAAAAARARTRAPRTRTHPTATRTPGARRLGGVGGCRRGRRPTGEGAGARAAARRRGAEGRRGEGARLRWEVDWRSGGVSSHWVGESSAHLSSLTPWKEWGTRI